MERIFKRYKADSEQKMYRTSFCAYFDILGFGNKVKDEDLDFFEHYLEVLQVELDYLNKEHDFEDKEGRKRFELKIFTDNFVIGYPWDDEYGEVELGDLFDILSRIQLTFAQKGIFIKGAISYSKLYMDENIVIGPALIDSYKLEEEKAVNPRIILSETAKKIVDKHVGFYSDDSFCPQKKTYLVDKDGFYFLNYLYHLLENFDPDYPNYKFIEKHIILHKKEIVKELKAQIQNQRVFEKFIWCAEYHNFFCDNFLNPKFYDLPKLKIKEILYTRNITRIQ